MGYKFHFIRYILMRWEKNTSLKEKREKFWDCHYFYTYPYTHIRSVGPKTFNQWSKPSLNVTANCSDNLCPAGVLAAQLSCSFPELFGYSTHLYLFLQGKVSWVLPQAQYFHTFTLRHTLTYFLGLLTLCFSIKIQVIGWLAPGDSFKWLLYHNSNV